LTRRTSSPTRAASISICARARALSGFGLSHVTARVDRPVVTVTTLRVRATREDSPRQATLLTTGHKVSPSMGLRGASLNRWPQSLSPRIPARLLVALGVSASRSPSRTRSARPWKPSLRRSRLRSGRGRERLRRRTKRRRRGDVRAVAQRWCARSARRFPPGGGNLWNALSAALAPS